MNRIPPELDETASADTVDVLARPDVADDATPTAPTESPTLIGRYRIEQEIGAGAMGLVYRARDETLGRVVAVKLMRRGRLADEAERLRFEREARALARLSHPNVVGVHEIGNHEEHVFIAMEYVPGPTLATWLEDQQRPWREVVDAFAQAGRGLAAAHDAGLVHRDFKPGNVILGSDGRARVVDFGLVRALAGAVELSGHDPSLAPVASVFERSLTATGAMIGTPAYMAPEQIEGHRADARTDQFGFCVALYEGLYRQRPFAGEQWFELTANVLGGQVREPDSDVPVPRALFEILRRGLAVEPGERWPSVGALLDVLEDHEGHGDHGGAALPGQGSRRSAWIVVIVVALVALGAALYALF